MILFGTMGSFTAFMLAMAVLLVVVGIYDEPIRQWEDRVIDRVKRRVSNREPSPVCGIEFANKERKETK